MSSRTVERSLIDARRAAVHATRAPSIHNTQPWQMVVRPDGLDLVADYTRRLPVLDRTGRQLVLSLGCAVMNARVSFAGDEKHVDVDRMPNGDQASPIARIRTTDGALSADDRQLAALEPFIELRHSNRREFADEAVPAEVIDRLVEASDVEQGILMPVLTEDHRLALARLSQAADREENGDPAYRAEMRRWTSDQPDRRDGLTQLVVPHVEGDSEDEIPIRDFDTYGLGWLPSKTHSSRYQCLLLLATADDTPADWLRAGEAMERVLLEITRMGYCASLFSQPIEVGHVREQLREALGLKSYPHMIIRMGRAPSTPNTLRRRLSDVLIEPTS